MHSAKVLCGVRSTLAANCSKGALSLVIEAVTSISFLHISTITGLYRNYVYMWIAVCLNVTYFHGNYVLRKSSCDLDYADIWYLQKL